MRTAVSPFRSAFDFEPHATEINKLGALPVLKARMNTDLHTTGDLAYTGKGNLFVILGESDLEIRPADGEEPETGRIQGKIQRRRRVPPEHPRGNAATVPTDRGPVHRHGLLRRELLRPEGVLLGANDRSKALRTTLKAETDAEAWATLYSDRPRPLEGPKSGRIAVTVINHLGDEVTKVFQV